MTHPIDQLEDALSGVTFERNVCLPARLLVEVVDVFRDLTENVDFALAFVPEEVKRPDASAIDTAIALLRRAADELDTVPAALRSPPPMLFTNVPRVSSALLRNEADHIAKCVAEIREADRR